MWCHWFCLQRGNNPGPCSRSSGCRCNSHTQTGQHLRRAWKRENHQVQKQKRCRAWWSGSYMALMLSVRLASKVRNCLPFLVNPRTWEPEQTKIFSCGVPAAPPRSILATFGPGSVLNTGWNREFLTIRNIHSTHNDPTCNIRKKRHVPLLLLSSFQNMSRFHHDQQLPPETQQTSTTICVREYFMKRGQCRGLSTEVVHSWRCFTFIQEHPQQLVDVLEIVIGLQWAQVWRVSNLHGTDNMTDLSLCSGFHLWYVLSTYQRCNIFKILQVDNSGRMRLSLQTML